MIYGVQAFIFYVDITDAFPTPVLKNLRGSEDLGLRPKIAPRHYWLLRFDIQLRGGIVCDSTLQWHSRKNFNLET